MIDNSAAAHRIGESNNTFILYFILTIKIMDVFDIYIYIYNVPEGYVYCIFQINAI